MAEPVAHRSVARLRIAANPPMSVSGRPNWSRKRGGRQGNKRQRYVPGGSALTGRHSVVSELGGGPERVGGKVQRLRGGRHLFYDLQVLAEERGELPAFQMRLEPLEDVMTVRRDTPLVPMREDSAVAVWRAAIGLSRVIEQRQTDGYHETMGLGWKRPIGFMQDRIYT